jgi:hypothetical protein
MKDMDKDTRIKMNVTYLDLYKILPHIDPPCDNNYAEFELVKAGYELRGRWHNGDWDSFGPLTRCINTDKGVVVYG